MHIVEISESNTQVILNVKGKPTGASLDPEHSLLIWNPEYGERPDV